MNVYIPPNNVITVGVPSHQDQEEAAHEIQTVLVDLTGASASVVADEEGSGLLDVVLLTQKGTYLNYVEDALSRIAERYGAPRIRWSYGLRLSAEAKTDA